MPLDAQTDQIVVVFDISSSSKIIDDLSRHNDMARWISVLTQMDAFVTQRCEAIGFSNYKFLGDGWIIQRPQPFDAMALLGVLAEIHQHCIQLFRQEIEPFLDNVVELVGISFGIDEGQVYQASIGQTAELIGRAINIAARLQSVVTVKSDTPVGKALMRRRVYLSRFKQANQTYRVDGELQRTLRNISGDRPFMCSRIYL